MKHLLWLCTLLMLVGCNKEMIEESSTFNEDFYAVFENADSRTYLDDRVRMRWHEKDCVTLFRKNTYNRTYMFKGQTGANAGGFGQVSVDDEFWYGTDVSYNYAVYPHSTDITLDETDCFLTVKCQLSKPMRKNHLVLVLILWFLFLKVVNSFLRMWEAICA